MAEIAALAEPLAGKRVLHLSATAFGGGVAEINCPPLVPLMADAGLDAEWRIMQPIDGFFDVTKTHPQRSSGQPRGPDGRATGRLRGAATRMNAEATRRRLRLRHRPRCAAGGDVVDHRSTSAAWIWRVPHRSADAERRRARLLRCRRGSPLRRGDLPPATNTSEPQFLPPTCTSGRPRSIRWRPRTWRCRRRTPSTSSTSSASTPRPSADPGLPLRPVEGPLGVIDAYRAVKEVHPGASSRSSARWRTTTRRAGSSTTRP